MDDYGDTPETAGSLMLGTVLPGSIETLDDIDWFKVDLIAGKTYAVEIIPSETDPLDAITAIFLKPDGSIVDLIPWLVSQANAGPGLLAHLAADETGAYSIGFTGSVSISGFDPVNVEDTGSYGVEVYETSALSLLATLEPSISSAGPHAAGSEVTLQAFVANIGAETAENVRVEFVISADAEVDASDPVIASAIIPNVPAEQFGGVFHEITATLPHWVENGSYLGIRIDPANEVTELFEERYPGYAAGFHADVSATPLQIIPVQINPGIPDGDGSSPDSAIVLSLGASRAASIDTADERDYYQVALTGGVTYALEVVSLRGAPDPLALISVVFEDSMGTPPDIGEPPDINGSPGINAGSFAVNNPTPDINGGPPTANDGSGHTNDSLPANIYWEYLPGHPEPGVVYLYTPTEDEILAFSVGVFDTGSTPGINGGTPGPTEPPEPPETGAYSVEIRPASNLPLLVDGTLGAPSINNGPTPIHVGDPITLEASISNTGLVAATDVRVDFVFSIDSTLGADDTVIASFVIPSIPANDGALNPVNFQFPFFVPEGLPDVGYLGFRIDPLNETVEIFEDRYPDYVASLHGQESPLHLAILPTEQGPIDDYGNTPVTAGTLPLDTTLNGSIEEAGDEDYFAVTLTAGTHYIFEVLPDSDSSNAIDEIGLQLFGPDGATIVREEGWDESFLPEPGAFLIFTPVSDGTYFLDVDGVYFPDINDLPPTPDQTGDYVVTAYEASALPLLAGGTALIPETDGNRPIRTGDPITLRAIVINTGITAATDVRVEFVISSDSVLDADDAVLATMVIPNIPADDGSFSPFFYDLPFVLPDWVPDGSYLGLRLDPLNETAELLEDRFPDYIASLHGEVFNLPLTILPAEVADDYGSTPATAGALTQGATLTGSIETLGDQDWFAVDLIAGQQYLFAARPDDGATDPLDQIELSLFAPDGTEAISPEINGFGVNGAYVLYTATETGTYQVAVDGQFDSFGINADDTGDYTVTYDAPPALPALAVFPGPTALYPGEPDPEYLDFVFPVTPGETATLEGAIANFGFADATNVRIDFVISQDANVDAEDPVFASLTLPSVPFDRNGAGTEFTLSFTVPATLRDGDYLGFVIDPLNEIEEMFEGVEPIYDQLRAQIFTFPLPVINLQTDWTLTEGDDEFIGFFDDETITGLGGNDTIDGRRGNDTIFGGNGDDLLIGGGGGGDLLYGGAGNDVLRGEYPEGFDLGENPGVPPPGGSGPDIAVFSGDRADYDVSYDEVTNSFTVTDIRPGSPDGTDTTFDISVLRFADRELTPASLTPITRIGGNGAETLSGGEGADSIFGGGGNDTLLGGFGADKLDGGGAADILYGGADDDTLLGGEGSDRLFGGAGADRLDGGAGLDLLYGGSGADIFVLSSDDRIDQVRDFQLGIDRIDASALGPIDFTDLVIRDFGAWVEIFYDGPDGPRSMRLLSEASLTAADLRRADFLLFGDDPDAPFDPVLRIEGTSGDDDLPGTNRSDIILGLAGNDTLSGLGGDDTLDGDTGSDQLFGGEDDDLLFGGGSNDTLDGGAGADTLRGEAGSDRLFGGDDADRLDGGPGLDLLWGGGGADVFVFSTDDRRDQVNDFEFGIDRIDMTALGPLAFTDLSIDNLGVWVEISEGGFSMLVRGTGLQAADLSDTDFIFA